MRTRRTATLKGSHHWILNGGNSREFYQEVHAWLARWLGGPATPSGGVHP